MGEWSLVENPAWTDKMPQRLERSACHDGSHFLGVRCSTCGDELHYHESAVERVPPDKGMASRCPRCGTLLEFPPGTFAEAFAEMRRRGWIR